MAIHVAVGSTRDLAGLFAKDVPDGRSAAIFDNSTFDLVTIHHYGESCVSKCPIKTDRDIETRKNRDTQCLSSCCETPEKI